MPYGGRFDRPGVGIFSAGGARRTSALVLLRQKVITVSEPMQDPRIEEPDFGYPVPYAANLYQRLLLVEPYNFAQNRSIRFWGSLYEADDESGGRPGPGATWTEITNSITPTGHGQYISWYAQDPSWYSSFENVDIYTYVHQRPESFDAPWTVVHELWGDAFYATRYASNEGLPLPEYRAAVKTPWFLQNYAVPGEGVLFG